MKVQRKHNCSIFFMGNIHNFHQNKDTYLQMCLSTLMSPGLGSSNSIQESCTIDIANFNSKNCSNTTMAHHR